MRRTPSTSSPPKPYELRYHDLPWPADGLVELGEAQVCLRGTLSCFIEANPAGVRPPDAR
ncbi:hypothetical protein [Amycolatopsis plumensis]|uniref:hypothetical protein n=1 Tax=Amycolatopsis plumensis TaxID=236508 RepID=UPI0036209DE4